MLQHASVVMLHTATDAVVDSLQLRTLACLTVRIMFIRWVQRTSCGVFWTCKCSYTTTAGYHNKKSQYN